MRVGGDERVRGAAGRIARGSVFNVAGQGCYAVFHLAVIFTLARALGPDGFGRYFSLFALILVVQLVVEAGTGTVLTRRLVRAGDRWGEPAAEGAGLYALIALGSAAAMLVLGVVWGQWAGDPSAWVAFAAAGVACAAIQVQRYCAAVFQALECFGYENVARVLQGAVFAGLVVGLVEPGRTGVAGVLVMLALSHACAALLLAAALRPRLPPLRSLVRRPPLRDWLGESAPLGFGDVVRGLTWQLDTVLLALLQPAAVVGLYSVAYRPLGPLNWLPRAVLTATFPTFTRMADGDRAGLGVAFAHSTRLLWVVSLPIAVGVCLAAEPLVRLLGGDEYREAAAPMRALIWIAVLSFLSMQFRYVFAAVGRQRLYARLVVMVFAVELVGEAVLIPYWGYWGACAGSLLGELLFTAVGLFLCHRLGLGGVPWPALGRSALAAAAMAVAVWPARSAPWPVLLAALAGATGLYFALCVVLGVIRGQELRLGYATLVGVFRPVARPARTG
jgi:O-antigen/teichoic acid export membrane protein